jgi:hypothetical protein
MGERVEGWQGLKSPGHDKRHRMRRSRNVCLTGWGEPITRLQSSMSELMHQLDTVAEHQLLMDMPLLRQHGHNKLCICCYSCEMATNSRCSGARRSVVKLQHRTKKPLVLPAIPRLIVLHSSKQRHPTTIALAPHPPDTPSPPARPHPPGCQTCCSRYPRPPAAHRRTS